MKGRLVSAFLGITILVTGCNKSNGSNETNPKLNALIGTWKVKSLRCYQNPTIIFATQSDAYFKFNSDLSGISYEGSITNHYSNFTYNLLDDDSTLILKSTNSGGALFDTSVITILTPTQLIFHGINTYAHGMTLCTNGNVLDSLYR